MMSPLPLFSSTSASPLASSSSAENVLCGEPTSAPRVIEALGDGKEYSEFELFCWDRLKSRAAAAAVTAIADDTARGR